MENSGEKKDRQPETTAAVGWNNVVCLFVCSGFFSLENYSTAFSFQCNGLDIICPRAKKSR